MTAVAVNTLVTEARRKAVAGSTRERERRSRTPYPRANTVFPSCRTRTARPGSPSRTRSSKRAAVAASFQSPATESEASSAATIDRPRSLISLRRPRLAVVHPLQRQARAEPAFHLHVHDEPAPVGNPLPGLDHAPAGPLLLDDEQALLPRDLDLRGAVVRLVLLPVGVEPSRLAERLLHRDLGLRLRDHETFGRLQDGAHRLARVVVASHPARRRTHPSASAGAARPASRTAHPAAARGAWRTAAVAAALLLAGLAHLLACVVAQLAVVGPVAGEVGRRRSEPSPSPPQQRADRSRRRKQSTRALDRTTVRVVMKSLLWVRS